MRFKCEEIVYLLTAWGQDVEVRIRNGVGKVKLPEDKIVLSLSIHVPSTFRAYAVYEDKYKTKQYVVHQSAVINDPLPPGGVLVIENMSEYTPKFATVDFVTADAVKLSESEFDSGPATIASTDNGLLVLFADEIKKVSVTIEGSNNPDVTEVYPKGTGAVALFVSPGRIITVEFSGKLKAVVYA